MAMVVKNNMSAVRTLATLNTNNTSLQESLAKVASGLKINSAKDDASGYAISERMRVQIRSLDQANQNTQNASSLMKNAEGAVERTVEILRTLKRKAIDAATDTNTDDDRATIQKELDQFIDQIDDNALITFNGKYLLEGSRAQSGNEVATHMTNSNLATDTTMNTALIALKNRNGESIQINSTDKVTVSFVMGGKTYSSTLDSVENTTRLGDIYNMLNTATNGTTKASDSFDSLQTDSSTYSATLSNTSVAWSADVDGKGTYDLKSDPSSYTITDDKGNTYSVLYSLSGNVASDTGADATCTWSATLTGIVFNNTTYGIDESGLGVVGISDGLGKIQFESTTAAAAGVSGMTGNVLYGSTTGTGGTLTSIGLNVNTASTTLVSFASSTSISTDTTIGTMASGKELFTADGKNALTLVAFNKGLDKQISGLSISVMDSEGNMKKATNTAFDAFKTTIYAANKTADGSVSFQIGASANQAIKVGLMDMRSEALGLKGRDGTTIKITTRDAANAAVSAFDNALNKALDQQTTIGAISARLEYTASNLTTSSENVQAAESTIRDADMAKEMTNYTKNNVLLQAAQSMLAQANQNSSAVLSLLQ